jgi:diguanylate cyclase (GGDEF)-like protein
MLGRRPKSDEPSVQSQGFTPDGVQSCYKGFPAAIHRLRPAPVECNDLCIVGRLMGATVQHHIAHAVTQWRRSVTTGTGVATYALVLWAGSSLGRLDLSGWGVGVGALLLGAGVLLFALAVRADVNLRALSQSFALPTALWASLSCAATASFGSGPLRLALLALCLLGLQLAALHLPRAQLRLTALLTWLVFSIGIVARIRQDHGADVARDQAIWMYFSALLIVALVIADRVAHLREELTGRSLELERALARVRDLAMRDDLTGLYNRRQLMEYLHRQKALADRGSLVFALCYIDLDHFKRVNDYFGHKQGDEVLKAFAAIAGKVVREGDFVARIGGEEFVLVLSDATLADAVQVSNRLRRQTQLMLIDPKAPDFAVTASVGVAAYRVRESVEQLMSRADTAMYAAKTQGRNRVVVAPETETRPISPAAGR